MHLGSFSKTLSAATRLGFLTADPATIADLTDLKLAMSFGNNELSAQLVYRLLSDGSYRKHVGAIRDRLARTRFQVAKKLTSLGFKPWLGAQVDAGEGMFLWMELPQHPRQPTLTAEDLAVRAQEEGIILAPGNVFSPAGAWPRHLRFNVAQSLDPRIYTFLKAQLF